MALLHVKQLARTNVVSTTAVTLATVPAGYRWVVRDVSVRNLNGSGSTTAYFFVTGTIIWSHVLATGGTSGDSFDWQPWVVMEPGDTIQMRASNTTGYGVVVSGSIYTI